MPHLHAINSHHQKDQNRSSIQLTPATTPAIAAVLIKSGLYADFANQMADAAKTPGLLQTVKPSLVKKAAQNLADQGSWGAFVQLVCAIQTEPKLLAVIKPAMVAGASAYLLSPDESGNAKAFNLNGISDFSEMVKAVSSQKNLMGAINADDVAKAASVLADHFSHTYDLSYGRAEPRVNTVYYQDKVESFSVLIDAVKQDDRLSAGIAASDVAKALDVLWKIGVEKTNEYATDQGYPTEVPEGFKGFSPLSKLITNLSDAPEAWQNIAAEKICELASAGMSHRVGPFTAKIIAKHEWAMDADQFTRAFNAQPNTDCMLAMLYQFAKVERMKPAYPAAIRSYLAGEMHSTGELHIHDDMIKTVGEGLLTAAGELVAKLADEQDYAALSRLMQRHQAAAAMQVMQGELSSRGLYAQVISRHDARDVQFSTMMGRRNSLDIVFRKATGDAVVCADPVAEFHGYTCTQRLPRDIVAPSGSLEALEAAAPQDIVPIMRLGFEQAATGQIQAPEWVQEIARRMLAATPAP